MKYKIYDAEIDTFLYDCKNATFTPTYDMNKDLNTLLDIEYANKKHLLNCSDASENACKRIITACKEAYDMIVNYSDECESENEK